MGTGHVNGTESRFFSVHHAVDVSPAHTGTEGTDQVVPLVVVDILLEVPVVVSDPAGSEAYPVLVAAPAAELPALAFTLFGNVGFPAAVRPFLDPSRYTEGVAPVESELVSTVRNGYVLVAVQVDRLARAEGYVGLVDVGRGSDPVIAVARGIGHGRAAVVVESPPAKQVAALGRRVVDRGWGKDEGRGSPSLAHPVLGADAGIIHVGSAQSARDFAQLVTGGGSGESKVGIPVCYRGPTIVITPEDDEVGGGSASTLKGGVQLGTGGRDVGNRIGGTEDWSAGGGGGLESLRGRPRSSGRVDRLESVIIGSAGDHVGRS